MGIWLLQFFCFETTCSLLTSTGRTFVLTDILLLQSAHDAVVASVTQALELGYRHFDTAAIYDTEGPLGHAIHEAIRKGVIKRQDVFITTKVFYMILKLISVLRISCVNISGFTSSVPHDTPFKFIK